MKIYCNQLRQNLKKKLAPIYLLIGEEPLQKMEAGDMIRRVAAQAGHTSARLFFIAQDSDWGIFEQALSGGSLFSEKSLFDVHLTSAISKAGVATLKAYSDRPADEVIVLVRARRVDAGAAWLKKISEQGVVVHIYGKNLSEMRSWVRERALAMGLVMENQVADIIAERLEGNLLAANQELAKLSLLHGAQLVRQEHVMAALNEHSLYSGFDFADAAVVGDGARAVRIMRSLRADGQPLVLIINALASQLRSLIDMETRLTQGEAADKVVMRAWRSKRPVFSRALARRRGARFWRHALRWCAELDKAVKGLSANEDWEMLLDLCLYLTPRPLAAKALG